MGNGILAQGVQAFFALPTKVLHELYKHLILEGVRGRGGQDTTVVQLFHVPFANHLLVVDHILAHFSEFVQDTCKTWLNS